jgi:hypothetical protein
MDYSSFKNITNDELHNIVDGIIAGRDKDESRSVADLNAKIAISSAILAVFSFMISTASTILAWRIRNSTKRKKRD